MQKISEGPFIQCIMLVPRISGGEGRGGEGESAVCLN